MTALESLKGVGAKTAEKLVSLGMERAEDLLFFLPKTYLDLTEFTDIETSEEGDFVLFLVKITNKSPLIKKNGRSIAVITGETGGAKIKLVFYNRDYVLNQTRVGLSYRVYGKFSKIKGFHITNPQIEEEKERPKLTGILPVYPLKGAVPQQTFRNAVRDAITKISETDAVKRTDETLPLMRAFSFAHCPSSIDEAKVGAERILLEKTVRELIRFRREKHLSCGNRIRRYNCTDEQIQKIRNAFPFGLNDSQNVAIATVIEGLRKNIPYHGMLTGDVGSGKTAVALFLAAYAALSGYQSVIMAPTELVAAQHAANAENVLKILGVESALLTSSVKGKARKELLSRLKDGRTDVLIGTHSVIGEDVELPRLSFAVVDEQHRFGVGARNALFSKRSGIDTLSMSATPIPRTLKLVYLGEHETLTLAPRHSGNNVKTRIVLKDKLDGMLRYLAEEARSGRRSFLVAPQISDVEGIPTVGAEDIFKEFQIRFPDVKCALLTGRMGFEEKEKTAEEFREGRVSVLVATTVVEVGLDVPDASTIAIMHADRLGLASLHQLRGRVGRAGQESYCFLYTERSEEVPRLKILTETTDGMKIAEADFRMRGAGELVGTSQHGTDRILAGVTEEMLLQAKAIADTKIL